MPSPFPGMDPYLESPDWFPNLHHDLIFCIKQSLRIRLPGSYYAQSDQRVWLEYSRRYAEPDVEIVRSGKRPRKRSRGGAAVAEYQPAEPLVVSVETIEHGPFKESFVEIRRRKGKEVRLVTSLEVLSPSNKTAGNPAREQYINKQREVLGSDVHLVEIDLLRGGTHTSAVPREVAEAKGGSFDYHVSVHRFNRPNDYFVYPIQLEQRLPAIKVPLLPGDPDVTLDLQAVFDQAYDAGPYSREVDYVRAVTVAQARREVLASREQTLAVTLEEQLAFWNALNETPQLTEPQRRLGKVMRGRS
ncbi:MAG: DUF4058 family protein [Isosphaerales bacterium]